MNENAQTDAWKPVGAAAKLAYIQSHVTNPDKTGRNTFHNFDYVQEHSVIELLRPLLRELHCAVIPSPAEVEVRVEDAETSKGKGQKLVTIVGEIKFIDSDEQPESLDREIIGRYTAAGADDLDKAHAKAQTIFVKYGLQKMFLIPTEKIEDGDADSDPEPPARSKPSSRRQSDPQPTAPATPSNGHSGAEDASQVDDATLAELRGVYEASKMTHNDLAWCIVAAGVESLPADPSREQVGAAMKALTMKQAREVKNFIEGKDDGVPGSGEAK